MVWVVNRRYVLAWLLLYRYLSVGAYSACGEDPLKCCACMWRICTYFEDLRTMQAAGSPCSDSGGGCVASGVPITLRSAQQLVGQFQGETPSTSASRIRRAQHPFPTSQQSATRILLHSFNKYALLKVCVCQWLFASTSTAAQHHTLFFSR